MPKEYIEDIVLREPVGLAVRDYGGTGQALILMHGGGRDARDWDALAMRVRARYRVLTFDFCGHGQSTRCAGPWTFAEGLADLDAVIAQYGVPTAVIAGHSLGGLVATMYGAQHPACRGVVNIDGIGVSVPETFPGPAPAESRRRVQAMIDLLASGPPPPDPPTIEEALAAAVLGCDVFALTATVHCPLLFIAAQEPEAGDPPDEMSAIMQLWRGGVAAEFARLAERQPNIGWATAPGDHLSILAATTALADHLVHFLDTLAAPRT
jgi:pimeloyl-ACP methyl ester carboxylesterase